MYIYKRIEASKKKSLGISFRDRVFSPSSKINSGKNAKSLRLLGKHIIVICLTVPTSAGRILHCKAKQYLQRRNVTEQI